MFGLDLVQESQLIALPCCMVGMDALRVTRRDILGNVVEKESGRVLGLNVGWSGIRRWRLSWPVDSEDGIKSQDVGLFLNRCTP